MQILFVHGMGRSPISALPLLSQLRRAGYETASFGYFVSFEDFNAIRLRLERAIIAMAEKGDYVLIGHSLGGVLIRAAVAELPLSTRMPAHIFLLGSPVKSSALAKRLRNNWLYQFVTRDCGQMLGSDERMQNLPPPTVPTTGIVGTRGVGGHIGPFGDELNDGVVSISEVSADWLTHQVQLPILHTLLPSSRRVARCILDRISGVA